MEPAEQSERCVGKLQLAFVREAYSTGEMNAKRSGLCRADFDVAINMPKITNPNISAGRLQASDAT